MMQRSLFALVLMAALAVAGTAAASEPETPAVDLGVDLFSRYVWRGTDIGASPSIQPSLSFSTHGFETGAWAAYSMSRESADSDEIDFWLSYARELSNEAGITLIVTDYYFPNAGVRFSKSDAHTMETGVLVTGPKRFPLTVSGYVNVSNDDGHNTYFQIDWPATVGAVDLQFFVGLAGGSKKNPDYYGTEKANVINSGVSATRNIEVTDSFSVPLTAALIYNPHAEVMHVVVGLGF